MRDGIGVFKLFIELKDLNEAELIFNEHGLYPKIEQTCDTRDEEIKYGYSFGVMTSKNTIRNLMFDMLERAEINSRVLSYHMN